MSELMNSKLRHDFVQRHIDAIKLSATEVLNVRRELEARVQTATSLQFGHRDRAALRSFLAGLIKRLRSGEIDERTAYVGINHLLMAARANNPDVLNIIHAGI